ncbi:cohesin loading factor subunit SCC2 [Paragonimus westermani]|uniref:Nipped-B protein n=1 Tax=Paragonimus westermani TaxID=34504 RepID=A0A5J4NSH1_9TREM|nr:cohesin loading factor subunit SCC2 [Paragonimus westermani]
MPGDIGRIPIISLGGCKPLSDIINELPVPQSTHVSIGCRTLLYEPKLVHEAYRCINGDDPRLFNALCSALKSVCSDDLTFEDCPQTKPEETTTYPLLLQALIANATFTRADGRLEVNATGDVNPVSCLGSDDLSNKEVFGAVTGGQENSDRESYCSTRIAPLRISLKKTSITCNNSDKLFKSKKTARRKERLQPNNEVPTPSKSTLSLPSSNELIDPGSAGEISDCRCMPNDSRESTLCIAKLDEKPLSPVSLNLAPTVSSSLTNHGQYSSADATITSGCPAVREQPVNVIDVNDNYKETACSASSNVIIQSPLRLTSLSDVPPSTGADCVKPRGSVAVINNPENVLTTTRRVPDLALSQLFHSAALFHTCQPSVDCEKSGLVVSGGLFDDWLDPSGKSSEAVSLSVINPPVSTECIYSGSISGPSSVTGNPSLCGQPPHSVGTALDTSACVPRSPQSVPSNHSSYPTTPGAGFPNVPLSTITNVVVPPSVLAKSAITNSTISSPSIRLFDNTESRPNIHDSSVDDQPRTAPHGLAAYLPRSSSLRSQLINEDPSTGLFFEELRPGSPRSNLSSSWDCSDPRSVSASEAGSRPTSTGKGLPRTVCSANDGSARHYNESPLPTKPNRGRFPTGKPRGGGRRRRTEVEELRIWNVNDRGQPGTDRKLETGPPAFTSPLLHELKESTVDKIAASNATNSAPNNGSTIGKRKEILETAQASEHGLFTEALVERVKRRRQQLEVGTQKQALQLEVSVNRSSEASPSSVSSPLRPSGRDVSSSNFTHTSKYLSIPSTNSEGQLDSTGRAPTDNTSDDIHNVFITRKRLRLISERYLSGTLSMKADCEQESCLAMSDSGVTENPLSRSSGRCEGPVVVSQQNSTTASCAPSVPCQHDGTKLQSVASKGVSVDKASDVSRNVADPVDNTSIIISEQSTDSIDSSSSPLPGAYGELYGSGQRCLTPSTIPYTHSSDMEDSDPRENDCVPLPGENKRHGNETASLEDSDDLSSCRSSTASEHSSPGSRCSSPSPSVTSLLGEDGGHCSADNDSDTERIRSEELTISASALTQFTNRLGEILRRVEELDLLKLASTVGLPKSTNFYGDDEFCGDSSSIPSAARLSRHELSALYTESAQIRLGGAMYTIPTGRLVRFLTLLLVNMQIGVQLPTSPLTTEEVVRFLERRNKHRHDSSRRIQADQVTESVLWSTPYWTAILTGLDCVRIALNIVVAPDMPRPLLMEDLVDGIISVTKHALAEILCKIPASVLVCTVRQSGQPAGLSMKNLWTFTTECVGYRVSQIMAVLTNLIRFQPNRFTDNLVIRLTGLGLYAPLFCLKSGRSLDRDPKRLSTPLLRRLCSSTSTASESGSSGAANMLLSIGTSRLWLLVWPGHLQRASLSLLAGVYGQYEAHRKLIVDEVFSTLLTLCSVSSNGSDYSVIKETRSSPPNDRRTARTFRILSSHWLYTISKQLKSRTELPRDHHPSGVVQPIDASKGQLFVDVHMLTALFLSLTQNLVQVPGSTSTGSVSGSGGGPRKSSVGSTEQSSGENVQFCKDEKHVLISYQTAVRHAHYLLSGLFKRLCSKTESDLRPVLETVTNDLISVANLASVEWPVSLTFISVLSGLVIQHLSQNGNANNNNPASHNSARAIDLCSKLTYIDTVTTLAIGLKRCFPTPSIRTDISDRTRCVSETVKTTTVESMPTHTREALAQARLIAFLSSPIPMVNNWMFEPGVSASQVDDLSTRWSRLDRECMQCIRLGYTDSLVLAAQRFHLASWLYDCSRELNESTNSSKSVSDLVNTKSGGLKNVRELEQSRHQLLSELAMTHHTTPTSLSWLTGCRHSGAVVGSSSLSSPTYSSRLSRNSTAGSQVLGASGSRNGSCSTPNKFLSFGGSILAPNAAAQRFVDCAHTRRLDSRCRLHFAAHAHWSARKLTSIRTISPGFEKLFSVICRLIGEPSVPVRTKALRSLASIVELDPGVFEVTRKPCETQSYCTTRCSAWLRDLPRLVHARLLDSSTAVREAAVDLVSRLLLIRPRMLPEYYPMLAERVLDKGVSVRKRAIRCFRDLLIVDWDNVAEELNRIPVRYKGTLIVRHLGIEMCLKLIRRLHDDEESIQLVVELFHNLWFTPISETSMNCSKLLDRRIVNLSAVTLSLRSGNFDTIEAFVKQILTVTDLAKSQQLDLACAQLVNRLTVRVKKLSAPFFSSDSAQPSNRLNPPRTHSNSVLPAPTLQCLLATLHLIGRCKPKLLISHCKFFFDFLHKAPPVPTSSSSTASVSSGTQTNDASSMCVDAQSMFHLLNIIEMTLSAFNVVSESTCQFSDIEIPDFVRQSRLHDLQRDLIRLIQRQGRLVVDSSLCCLATLVNRVLKDHNQVAVCFGQFYGLLMSLSFELRRTVSTKVMNAAGISSRTRPSVLRALYTVGLMCKHFRLEDLANEYGRVSTSTPMLDELVDTLMLFAEYAAAPVLTQTSDDGSLTTNNLQQMHDPDLCRKAVMGLGFVVCRHDQLLCTKRVRTFFSRFFTITPLAPPPGSSKPSPFHEVQCIILDNLTHYLIENERQMVTDSRQWAAMHKTESLKELADRRSGHGSAIAQEYLPMVLKHCVLNFSLNVRTSALSFLSVILRQGLVHPVQMLPSLVCLQTDPDSGNRSRASHLLIEAERKVPGFIAMRAATGVQMTYRLHLLWHITALETDRCAAPLPLVRGVNQEGLASTSGSVISASNGNLPTALNHAVYTMLRPNRQSRRSFISSVLSVFSNDQKPVDTFDVDKLLFNLMPVGASSCSLGQMIFIADQLAHFPYSIQDEVFYVAFSVERLVSDCGPSLLRLMHQTLLSSMLTQADSHSINHTEKDHAIHAETQLLNVLEFAETKLTASKVSSQVDSGTSDLGDWDKGGQIQNLFTNAQPASLCQQTREAMVRTGPVCFLLLAVRNHLREVYGVTDSKLKDYSPTDAPKQWDKPIQVTKRPNSSSPILRLPTWVMQCMQNPTWFDLSDVPPDALLLAQFIRLRHQLLSLEGGASGELIKSEPEDSESILKSEQDSDDRRPHMAGRNTYIGPKGDGKSSMNRTFRESSDKIKSNFISPCDTPSNSNTKQPYVDSVSESHDCQAAAQLSGVRKRKAVRRSSISSLSSSSSDSPITERNKHLRPHKDKPPARPIERNSSQLHRSSDKTQSRPPHHLQHQNRCSLVHAEQRVPRPTKKQLSTSSELDSDSSVSQTPVNSVNPKWKQQSSRKPDVKRLSRKPSQDANRFEAERLKSLSNQDTGQKSHPLQNKEKHRPRSHVSVIPEDHLKTHRHTASNYGMGTPSKCKQTDQLGRTSSNSVRSLAPLPQAMMQPAHASRSAKKKSTPDKYTSRRSLESCLSHRKPTAVAVVHRTSESPIKPFNQTSKDSSHHATSNTVRHSVKPRHSMKPQTVRKLSDSSSLSSDTDDDDRKSTNSSLSSTVSTVSTPSDCSLSSSSTSDRPVKVKKSRKLVS